MHVNHHFRVILMHATVPLPRVGNWIKSVQEDTQVHNKTFFFLNYLSSST